MDQLYKYPLLQISVMALAMVGIFGATSWSLQVIQLPQKHSPKVIHQQSTGDRVLVQAAGKCPYSAPVSLGVTAGGGEMRTNPAKDPKVYDVFNTANYLLQSDGRKTIGTTVTASKPDPKLPVIGTMFGFKPSSAAFYRVLETNNTPVPAPWLQYALGVPTAIGDPIRAPQTGYDIGGGKIGLVTFAAADRLTIHIGRHEYLTGTPGTAESGGYWIYVKGLCVNQQIVGQYNANATTRTQLPELAAGELLGYATGNEVMIAVRDNGPFQDILGNEWWGSVPVRADENVPPANQPPVAVQPPAQQPPAQTPGQPTPQPQQPVLPPNPPSQATCNFDGYILRVGQVLCSPDRKESWDCRSTGVVKDTCVEGEEICSLETGRCERVPQTNIPTSVRLRGTVRLNNHSKYTPDQFSFKIVASENEAASTAETSVMNINVAFSIETTIDSQGTNATLSDIISGGCKLYVYIRGEQQPIAQSSPKACTDKEVIDFGSLLIPDSSVKQEIVPLPETMKDVIKNAIAPQGVIITQPNNLTVQEHNLLVNKTVRVNITMPWESSCSTTSTSAYCLHQRYLTGVDQGGMSVILMEASGVHLTLSGRNLTSVRTGERFTISFDYTYPPDRQLRSLEPVGISGPFVITYR